MSLSRASPEKFFFNERSFRITPQVCFYAEPAASRRDLWFSLLKTFSVIHFEVMVTLEPNCQTEERQAGGVRARCLVTDLISDVCYNLMLKQTGYFNEPNLHREQDLLYNRLCYYNGNLEKV